MRQQKPEVHSSIPSKRQEAIFPKSQRLPTQFSLDADVVHVALVTISLSNYSNAANAKLTSLYFRWVQRKAFIKCVPSLLHNRNRMQEDKTEEIGATSTAGGCVCVLGGGSSKYWETDGSARDRRGGDQSAAADISTYAGWIIKNTSDPLWGNKLQLLPCPRMQYLEPWNGRGSEAYFLLVCIRAVGAPSLQSDVPWTAEAAPCICDAARLPGARGSIEAEIISVRQSDPGHLLWKQNPGVRLQRGCGEWSRMEAFARSGWLNDDSLFTRRCCTAAKQWTGLRNDDSLSITGPKQGGQQLLCFVFVCFIFPGLH